MSSSSIIARLSSSGRSASMDGGLVSPSWAMVEVAVVGSRSLLMCREPVRWRRENYNFL
jgi:hypothetical protein